MCLSYSKRLLIACAAVTSVQQSQTQQVCHMLHETHLCDVQPDLTDKHVMLSGCLKQLPSDALEIQNLVWGSVK